MNHAWTAYPGYLFLKYICGIQPTSGGFATFDVRPETGGLTFAEGTVPTVKGLITTRWEKMPTAGFRFRLTFLPTPAPPSIFPNFQKEISPSRNPENACGRQNRKSTTLECSPSRKRIPPLNVWWLPAITDSWPAPLARPSEAPVSPQAMTIAYPTELPRAAQLKKCGPDAT